MNDIQRKNNPILAALVSAEAWMVKQMDEAEQQEHMLAGCDRQSCVLCEVRAAIASHEPVDMVNPRFVWNVGSIGERFQDMACAQAFAGLLLWDRQERRQVMTVHPDYANAMCLETQESGPLSDLADWFNHLTNEALTSENMTATAPQFRK